MSLVQQLSSAVLGATEQDSASGTETAQALLRQLAASVAAIHAHHQQQQQGHTAISASRLVQEVQAGLQASNEQLQRLLGQQQQNKSASTHEAAVSEPASMKVLQQLLQLAVGDACCSIMEQQHSPSSSSTTTTTMPAGPQAGTSTLQQQQQQQQQQQWQAAAREAVQLFTFQELEQLPPHILQQALALHPNLLTAFLEAAAAAVLQPVLSQQHSTCAGDTRPPVDAQQQDDPQQPNSNSTNSGSGNSLLNPGSNSSSATGGLRNMQSLLSAACPWMQHLPGMLAQNPLLLKASSTLLSWCEASGHVRLWQLLSITCRPAWQQLATATAAAAAVSVPGSASAGAFSTVQEATSTSLSTLQWPQLQQQQQSLAGLLALLCPQAWQQQLVCLLAQEPSVLDLLLLLQQLPGLAVRQQQQQQQQQATGSDAVPMQIDAAGDADADADAKGGRCWSSEELLSWPPPREWGQPAAAHPVQQATSRPQQQQQQQQEPGRETRGEVMLAWGLVMQHRCWYQFACTLLVHSSLQQQQQRQEDCTLGTQQLQQLLMLSAQDLQQSKGLSSSQLAAAAAAFIAWVHQPVNCSRQACLQEQLLSVIGAGSRGTDNSTWQQDQPGGSLLQAARSLLAAWATSLQPHSSGGAAAASGPGAALDRSSSSSWVSPVLYQRDLPCAVLHQKQLLLECTSEQLTSLCLEAATAPAAATQEQQPGVQPNSSAVPAAALCQLLDCTNDVCGAAVEVVSAAMRHTCLQQQQQTGPGSSKTAAADMSWLARLWLDAGSSMAPHNQGVAADAARKQNGLTDLAVAKQLLAAATGVDQHLKQHTPQGAPL